MKAIITGATKGIGRAIAENLAKNGFDIAICARTPSDLDKLKKQLEAKYPVQVWTMVVDMSIPAAVKKFANDIAQKWPDIAILVNNAGVFLPCELANPEQEQDFRMMMDLNLYSAYYMTQGILPLMKKQQSGHIFNICSIASLMPYGAYAVSKHALLGYSKVLRDEVKTKGIKVTSILPGETYTASWESSDVAPQRLMKAEDIAQSLWAVYQLSDQTVVEEILLRPQLGSL